MEAKIISVNPTPNPYIALATGIVYVSNKVTHSTPWRY